MPDPVTAAIGGSAVLGAATSASAASKASKSANAAIASADSAAALQYQASTDQLELQKQQYADWENIFGPTQQHLSNYYQNLSPDTVAALGLQNIEKEYSRSTQALDQNLAKRGITNSGATTMGLTQLESARMLGRAEVQANAPAQANAQKAAFLQLGMGQQANLQSGIANSYTNQMNILGQQATNANARATNYSNQAAAGYAGIGSSVGQGINSYMMYNSYQSQANLNNALAAKIV